MGQTRVRSRDVRDESITDADVAPGNKDGLAATPSLRTLGTGAQQACAGDDPRLTDQGCYDYFKHSGLVPFSAWYVAGMVTAQNMTTGAGGLNILRALPIVVPRGGNLDLLAFNNTTIGGGSTGRVGIYEATSQTNIYPGNLLFDSGSISLAVSGVKTIPVSPSVALSRDKLYWLCYVGGGSSETLRSLNINACYPIFGIDQAFVNASTAVGLTVSFTFGALPSTFPVGASLLTSQPIPALAFRLA